MKLAIVDVDDTLCPSIFKNIVHNDNGLLRTPGFEKQLMEVTPYKWAREWDWKQYDKIVVNTGRLVEWNDITRNWLFGMIPVPVEIINVEWDDSYPTREESYKDYVKRKIFIILHVIKDSGSFESCHVFEDTEDIIQVLTDNTADIMDVLINWLLVSIYQVTDGELKRVK